VLFNLSKKGWEVMAQRGRETCWSDAVPLWFLKSVFHSPPWISLRRGKEMACSKQAVRESEHLLVPCVHTAPSTESLIQARNKVKVGCILMRKTWTAGVW